MIFNLLGNRHTLLSRQATWIAAKLTDSTLNGPLFAMCCATAAMFFVPRCIWEFGHLMHIINFKGNYSCHGLKWHASLQHPLGETQ